ncbi:uncharacterized protein MONBRDRAFT_22902 [Monosiga brevicollis MX1]|uniref:SLC26A/SulP transporter domain-containing protein n=1 Tax=Monosiga brevicollis TaxID=81824 RepID=A9USE6_MONBE|nr:uncharacterized protein MONBRDRAFT_22902 [Monosiga brevicollis MX1]EDQ92088.1 predicted protein [Monosiga brevicollis MX1]|eukprot:XP_001743374.1 hypothetical protein [Monosiga brevicollis MX1]
MCVTHQLCRLTACASRSESGSFQQASLVNFGSLGLFQSVLQPVDGNSYFRGFERGLDDDEELQELSQSTTSLQAVGADGSRGSASHSYGSHGSSRDGASQPLLHAQSAAKYQTTETVEVPSRALSPRQRLLVGLLYGCINSIILIPVLISFAQIIFRDPYYKESMPYLIKLVILSSSIHQIIFTTFSTLTFAIGQVQDAGLIFLSSMASAIVTYGKQHDLSHADVLATTLCWLAISTASLGAALFVTGRLKLASLVQYLPLAVIAGYLAFIGLYCFEAGLSLMSGKQILTFRDWGAPFNRDSMILITPGLLLGIGLIFVTNRFRHFAVLPCCLLAIPVIFHIILAASGTSLDEARVAFGEGWLAPSTGSTKFWEVWEHYQFGKVHWGVVPKLIPTWIAMYFVVAFSSSLDVAAIQMELGSRLDFNKELCTVGISNLVSGLTGGFTGSYIFSQTLFTMRANVNSRMVGALVIALEVAIFMVPVSILAFVPKFFFGSVLTFIALELMFSWLILSFKLVHVSEYIIIWLTFIAILMTNLEIGMGVGCGLSILNFIFQYAQTKVSHQVYRSSNVQRDFQQRSLLAKHRSRIISYKLSGYIFFGSSLCTLTAPKLGFEHASPSEHVERPNKKKTLGLGL